MAKYEIMVLIDSELGETVIASQITNLKDLLPKSTKFETTKLGFKNLAYPINKKNNAYYVVFNFSNEHPEVIAEFRRLALLNKAILRHMIINLEKDYGYKWTVNPKKVAKSKFRAERYKKIKAEIAAEQEKYKVAKDTSSVKLTDI